MRMSWARMGWAFFFMFGLIVSGCVQPKSAGSTAAMNQVTAIQGAPAEMVSRLGDAIDKARASQLDILSPRRFARADEAYGHARETLSRGGAISDIQASVLESEDYLAKARAIADISRKTLADTLTAREKARDAGATKLEKDYENVENEFLDLTRSIEKGKFAHAEENRGRVAEQYRELEIMAIKEAVLGEVRQRIAQSEAENARKLVPEAHAYALGRLTEAEVFISAHPYDRQTMASMAEEALFQANRLSVLTTLANRVKKMRPEEIAALVEEPLHTIATTLDSRDLRDQSPQAQVDTITGAIDDLKSDRQFLSEKKSGLEATLEAERSDCQMRIDELNIELAMLAGKSREDRMAKERMARERMAVEKRLAKEREFNQRYATVRNFFEENEAEVYKQENELVLRLKAMRFPVGKSVLLQENDDLLAKVRKAIGSFEDPRVIIEGHTDSTGSLEANMLLSQKRAEAVRDYLIANQPIAPERISAVGYGPERPLASDATPQGRAINRRIDIRIIPQDNIL